MIADPCTYGAAQFEIIIDSPGRLVPKPRAKKVAEWVHVPYGGNKRIKDGSRQATQWSIRIRVPDAANLSLLEGYYDADSAQTLVAPGHVGTIGNVFLTDLPDMSPDQSGRFSGSVVFEWA